MIGLYIGLGVLGLLILIVFVKTIQFKPVLYPEMKKKYSIDEKRVIENLSEK